MVNALQQSAIPSRIQPVCVNAVNWRLGDLAALSGALLFRLRKHNHDATVIANRNRVRDRIIIALKLRGQDGRQQTRDQHEKESNPHWGNV